MVLCTLGKHALLAWTLAALAVLGFSACKSSDGGASQSSAEEQGVETDGKRAGPKIRAAEVDSRYCQEPPELLVCCTALTPDCNECREVNRNAQREWDHACLGKAPVRLACGETPPASSCCGDNSEACRECRELAFNALMEWRRRCGSLSDMHCDKPPPEIACCKDNSPSCDACIARNLRLRQDWRIKCGREP